MEFIIQSALQNGQESVFIVAAIFATGLLTSLTPCIYPMLPITVSVIGSQAKNKSQSIGYSLIYVSGLALVYASLGMLAASTGQLFGAIASHPITLSLVAAFCSLMAMWILGWLKLPNITLSHQIKNQYVPINIFITGGLSGLIMAPCTSPVLGMLLMYVAGEGSQIWAALLMFTFAFGMSALLIIAGCFSGFLTSLPRSGNWLNITKWLMALPMFGASIYLIFTAVS
jgi:thiol:disulfide interchange protein DsbD